MRIEVDGRVFEGCTIDADHGGATIGFLKRS